MKAPTSNSNRLDVPPMESGFQLGVIWAVVNIGTHPTNFGDKNQIIIASEFPQQRAVFYDGEDQKPYMLTSWESFSMAPKANLKKIVDGVMGRSLSDDEAANFDLKSLIGKVFVANVVNVAKGDEIKTYIDKYSFLNEKMMSYFNIDANNLPKPENRMVAYSLEDGFESELFKALPKWMADRVKSSKEGQSHVAAGGKFAELNNYDNGDGTSSTPKKLVMIDSTYTYEQYVAGNWTDQMLVDAGHAKWDEPAAPKPPAPAPAAPAAPAPSAPVAPVAPAPVQATPPPPTPPTVPSVHPIKMNDGSGDDVVQAWLDGGWTYKTMVDNGHATFLPGQGN